MQGYKRVDVLIHLRINNISNLLISHFFMIYIAYKTYSLRKELLNQGIKIDDFQAYIKSANIF